MNLAKEKNPKDINITIKKTRKDKIDTTKKEEKNVKQNNKNNYKSSNKNKSNARTKKSRFQIIVFPISQITGKIKIKKNQKYNLPNISSADIIFIMKLISKESHNFSPVKSRFNKTLFFTIICLLSFALSIFFFHKKKVHFGLIFLFIFLIFGFIYLHKVRKAINNDYKKCQRKLFRLSDHINRKLLGKLGYYLLIDCNFRFIGIYVIPGYIKSILELREHNIEIKKNLEGRTIDQMNKKENYVEHPKYEDFMNNMLLKNIKGSTLRNYGFNYYDDLIVNEEENIDNKTLKNDKIKFNNFFKENNNNINDLIDKDDTIDIKLTNKERIRLEYAKKVKLEKRKSDSLDDSDIYPDYYPNKNFGENNNNSKINNRSIDKFKSYFGNSFNGIEILNN
jgi:lipopolysaccharide export LptBFGC system permease protein LptF